MESELTAMAENANDAVQANQYLTILDNIAGTYERGVAS